MLQFIYVFTIHNVSLYVFAICFKYVSNTLLCSEMIRLQILLIVCQQKKLQSLGGVLQLSLDAKTRRIETTTTTTTTTTFHRSIEHSQPRNTKRTRCWMAKS
jgi:hypothetical protein